MKICRCGKVITDNIPRCDECQDRYDKDNKDRNRYYNRHYRDKDIQKIYSGPRWNIMVTRAKDRDNGLCKICLISNVITYSQAVHHVIPLEDDKSKAYELENLICLCERCHQLIHCEYRKGSRAKKEAQSFLFSLI